MSLLANKQERYLLENIPDLKGIATNLASKSDILSLTWLENIPDLKGIATA